ncbi:hypothetical protein PHMEG_00037220 [Phytophthora megakarya]|uniref:Uncharacterized protein n=1 Tax=Phytophthora megakarya TaxID=4795 RepID=A0A225UKF0_9STRA|nr:hypothetical protein PHMEG_00037220 [Phytophthora megakarya]
MCTFHDGLQQAIPTTVDELPETFRVTEEEKHTRYGSMNDQTFRCHCQGFQKDDHLFYVNSDLVVDNDQGYLCGPFAANPRDVCFSIADGNDYGRRGDVPALNHIATNCKCLVRRFGLEISISGKHLNGHVICFASDGPVQCTKPGPESMPRVTFIGPNDQWRLLQRNFPNVYDLPEDYIYRWLSMLSDIHSYWIREDIVVDDLCHRRAELRRLENEILRHVVLSTSDVS